MYKVLEDLQQKDKEKSFEKVGRSNNRSEKAELKHIKNQAIQMFNEFRETYVEL